LLKSRYFQRFIHLFLLLVAHKKQHGLIQIEMTTRFSFITQKRKKLKILFIKYTTNLVATYTTDFVVLSWIQ